MPYAGSAEARPGAAGRDPEPAVHGARLGPAAGRLQLEKAWAEAVGSRVRRPHPARRLRRGVLEVMVDNAVLLQELAHFHKRRLLEQLRRRLPDTPLTDLRFRAGCWNESVMIDEPHRQAV